MQDDTYFARSLEEFTFADALYQTPDEFELNMTTPSAIQRRREQNRIAQRNHRRKVKGQLAEQEKQQQQQHAQPAGEQSSHGNSPAQTHGTVIPVTTELRSSQSPHLMPVTMPCTQPASMTPWLGYDFGPQQPTPVLPPPPHTLGNEGDILMNFDQEFASMLSPPRAKIFGPNHCLTEFPYRCNCSSFSGPCEFHREELKAQFAFPMAPGQPLGSMGPPFMDVPPIPEMAKVETSPPQSRTSPIISRPGSEARSSLQSSRTSSSTDTKHSSISTNSSGTNISKTAGSTRIRKRRASKANSTRSKASPAPEDVSTQTGKFKHILESIQDVGFEDFDSMVSQYYTCHFEKNSMVDVAQKTSRGRRLRQVLTSLQESSSDWTLWEARGYRDKIVEGAEGIYVDELKRLAKRRRNSVSGGRAGSSDSNMEESLSDAGSSSSNASAAGKSQPREPELQTPTGDVLRVYQNKLPNLWALLTELAGTQGPHCERAALAAALVLYNARQNPDLDCKQLISKSFKDSDLLPVGSGA